MTINKPLIISCKLSEINISLDLRHEYCDNPLSHSQPFFLGTNEENPQPHSNRFEARIGVTYSQGKSTFGARSLATSDHVRNHD